MQKSNKKIDKNTKLLRHWTFLKKTKQKKTSPHPPPPTPPLQDQMVDPYLPIGLTPYQLLESSKTTAYSENTCPLLKTSAVSP